MFQLNPINRDIRKELHFREASIAKTVLQSAKDPQTGKSNELAASFYPLGTIWIKMTSVVETPKSLGGVVMLGGEMLDPDGDQSFSKMRHGFDEIYTQPITDGEGEIQPSYFRPLAGVKGLSSTYDGGMKAIRNATVTWSCFSLKELNRLTPYFLSHGTSVLLEWGWTSNKVAGQTFTFEEIKEGQCYTNIQDKIIKNGGNYDAMCGIIKNFSWSLREDGGFDCSTDVVAMGVSMIDSKVKQAVDLDYAIQERVEEDGSKVTYKMIPKVTMPKYIKDLSSQLKEFAEKPGKGVLFMVKEGDWMHFDVDIGPYVTWGWMEDNIISKFLSKVNTRTNLIISDMRSIQKGKSTIIMNHEKLLTTDRNSFIIPGQWPAESLRDSHLGDVLDNVQEDVKEKVAERAKEEPPDATTGWRSWGIVQFLQIDDAVDAIQAAGDFIVDAAAVGWEAIKAVVESLGGDYQEEVTRGVAKRVNDEFDKFAVSDNLEDGGYLRNLLIHWKTIERAFGEVATVEAGFKNLFDELNKDFGLWDFSITSDQNNTGRMMVIDINYVNNSIESLLEDESRFEDGEVKGRLFKFKTWREESIVKAQGMEAKLPSSMATAAMLGRNTKSETVGEEDPQGEGAGAMNKDKKDPILGPMLQGWKFPSFGLMDPNPDIDGVAQTIPPLTVDAGPTLGELTPDDEDEVIIGTEGASSAQKGGAGSEDDSEVSTTDFQNVVANIKALSEGDTLPVISHIYNQYGAMKPKYIKQMKTLILAAPGGSNKATADILVPIDLSLTIDGIGGIYPGNVFTSDYLPEDYKRTCVFQVKSISHEVGDTGWDCVLEGQIRLSMSRIANKVKIADAGQ